MVSHVKSYLAKRFRTAGSGSGFTITELLVALLVVTMVSIIVATGVPSAINAYRGVVASSNAQVALSTTTTVLRDELGMATGVTSNSGTDGDFAVNTYTCGEGYKANITSDSSHRGPVKTAADDRLPAGENGKSWALVPDSEFVTSQGNLRVEFDPITYNKSEHAFKVSNLRVVDENGNVLARIGDDASDYFAIRAPYCEVTTS